MPRVHFDINGRQDIRNLEEFRSAVKQVLEKAYAEGAEEALDKIRPLVPVRTGRLRDTLKAKGTKASGVVRAGTPRGVPYAGVVHWGRDGRSGPRFIWNQLTEPPHTTGKKPAEWLVELMTRHANEAIDKLNSRLRRAVMK